MSSPHPPFSSVFIPCTSPDSTCTITPQYFFGTAGTCNTVTNLCECPSGYNGVDSIVEYNDCHINMVFRNACYISVLVLTAIAIAISIAGLGKLAIMWGVLFWQHGEDDHSGAGALANGNGAVAEERSELRTRDISHASKHTPRPIAPHLSLQMPSNSTSAHTSGTLSPMGAIKTLQHYTSQQQQQQQSPTTSPTAAGTPTTIPSPGGNSPSRGHSKSAVAHTAPLAASPTRAHAKSATQPPSPVRPRSKEGPTSSALVASPVPGRSTLVKQFSVTLPLEELPSMQIRRESTDAGNNSDEDEEPRTNMSKSHQPGSIALKRKKSRAPRLSMKPMQHPKTNVRSATFVQDMLMAKRRRNTCILMSSFAAYSCYSFIVLVMFQQFFTVEMRNGVLLWALWSALACLQGGLWVMAYSWCATLPSMKSYAKMFPTFNSHPLMKFPTLPRVITIVSVILLLVISCVFFFILPLTIANEGLRNWVIPTGLTLHAVLLLVLMIFQTTVFSLLLKMFDSFNASQRGGGGSMSMDQIGASANPRGDSHGKAFSKARRTIIGILLMGWVFGPFAITFLLVAAWGKEARKHMYFFMSALFGLATLIVIGSTYITVYRIASTAGAGLGQTQTGRLNGSMVLRSQNNDAVSTTRGHGHGHHTTNGSKTGGNNNADNQVRASDGAATGEEDSTPRTPKRKVHSNRSISQAIKQHEVTSNDSSEVQLG